VVIGIIGALLWAKEAYVAVKAAVVPFVEQTMAPTIERVGPRWKKIRGVLYKYRKEMQTILWTLLAIGMLVYFAGVLYYAVEALQVMGVLS